MNSKAQRPASIPAQRRPKLSVAPFEGYDRSAAISLPQEIIDEQLSGLTEGELKVLLAVIRATNGGQREQVPLTVRVLCSGAVPDVLPGRGTGLSARTVQTAYTKLEHAGYVRMSHRTAADGSGMPSLFTLPFLVPSLSGAQQGASVRFPGYSAARRVRLPLLVMDRLLAELSGAELKVLLYVLRHTFCVGMADEVMPMARLVDNTGLSLRHTRLAVTSLTAKGYLLVLHRQDPERGKLPSKFGVRVIGEPAPFIAPQVGGAPVRTARVEDSAAEISRPVWLVPTQESNAEPGATPESALLQVVVSAAPLSPAVPAQPQPSVIPRQMSPTPAPSSGSDIRVARSSSATSMPLRTVPAELLQDNNPIWASVKAILADKLPLHVFEPWIGSTASVSSGGEGLLIAVRDEHHRWYLESKLQPKVRAALEEAGHGTIGIRYLNFNGSVPKHTPIE